MSIPIPIPHPYFPSLDSALAVLTSMITPTLLITATGTFILSTSTRLGRVVDRVRKLTEIVDGLMTQEQTLPLVDERRRVMLDQMDKLGRRATLLQRSLTIYYTAAGLFVSTSVAIGLVTLASLAFFWVPVVLGVGGAMLLLWGTALLIFEARLAGDTLSSELSLVMQLVQHHTGKSREIESR